MMTLYPFAARIGATSSKAWMSYGQPCSNTTGGPLAGPASAYPTLRTPASICLIESNDEPVGPATAISVSGVMVVIDISENLVAPDRAATSVMIAVPKKRRRSLRGLPSVTLQSRLLPARSDVRRLLGAI